MTDYFDLADDVYLPGRWELGNPTDGQGRKLEDPWMFRIGAPVDVATRLRIPIERPGRPLDFSLAGFSVPVVHARVASMLANLAATDVQLIPVEVGSDSDPYFILVATRLIRCIDDERSTEVLRWSAKDGRPEKIGQYRDVYGMRIDRTQVGKAKVFRTWGWTVALIVSAEIKEAMERAGVSGARFREV